MLKTFITKTDSSCVIDGSAYRGMPLLVTDNAVLDAQSDYLRDLTVKRGLSPGSVHETSKYLRTHLHIADAAGLQWEQTNEAILRRWRNEKAGARPSNPRRAYLNQVLRAIYCFLIWAERSGRISGVVGPLSSLDRKAYPLPVEVRRARRDGAARDFHYPLLYRVVGQTDQRNATASDIDKLYVAIANEANAFLAERNLLIARFAENALLRRLEVASLRIGQLPDLETAIAARSNYEELTIDLTETKGSKPRLALVDPQLVIDTWNHIDGARSELITSKRITFSLDDPIFVSARTGKQMNLDSISNLFSAKQREAGVSDASIHHLRSIGATDRVERVIEMYEIDGAPLPDEETLLLQVQEVLGHASTDTTRKYIRREKKRRLDQKRAENSDISDRRQALRNLDREIAAREEALRRLGKMLDD